MIYDIVSKDFEVFFEKIEVKRNKIFYGRFLNISKISYEEFHSFYWFSNNIDSNKYWKLFNLNLKDYDIVWENIFFFIKNTELILFINLQTKYNLFFIRLTLRTNNKK